MKTLLAVLALCFSPSAFDGSETWLHYAPVDERMRAGYLKICKSLVLSDTLSDTLNNARAELDRAVPALLGRSALPLSDGNGAIVLAPQGSNLLSSAGIDFGAISEEGFIIKSGGGKTYISGKNQIGVLRGVFHFLQLMQTARPVENLMIVENPYFPRRILDHWYNHYGSTSETERVYGGNRLFKMENFGSLTAAEKTRIINYCRMAASLGLNGICPDNVKTYRSGSLGNFKCLEAANLKTQKTVADIFGTFGLKYYLSVSFGSPKLVGPAISSAFYDVSNPETMKWWSDKVDTVRSYIGNFGGFVMDISIDGLVGDEMELSISQSKGANPIARALGRYGYVLIVRAAQLGTADPDFAVSLSKEFTGQTWDSAVILRTRDGPRDFQIVEPPNPLLALSGVRHGMEFQITQEYTGQAIHLCWLVPKWKQVLDGDIKGAAPDPGTPGTVTGQILRGTGDAARGGGVWGISNFSDTVNWTGHFLAQANAYGFGRLAWNPTLPADRIADEWIRCSFDNGNHPAVRFIVKDMLCKSWKTYEDYTISYSALMPALMNNNHYEVSFSGMKNSPFFTPYLMNMTADGIGVDRTPATGNNMAGRYPAALADSFATISKCPEDYLLFFHHCPWEYRMKSGMTLIQSLHCNHFRGVRQVRRFIDNWNILGAIPGLTLDGTLRGHVADKLALQLRDATRWATTFRADFNAYYPAAVPCDFAILAPDSTKAVTIDNGGSVDLSVRYRDQYGAAVNNSVFAWSVDRAGATVNAVENGSARFVATDRGVYTVTAAAEMLPDLKDELQIFVGDWWKESPVATHAPGASSAQSLSIIRLPRGILITVPSAGKIDIVGLQGRVAKSIDMKTGGTALWDCSNVAAGMYLIRLKNGAQSLFRKLIIH